MMIRFQTFAFNLNLRHYNAGSESWPIVLQSVVFTPDTATMDMKIMSQALHAASTPGRAMQVDHMLTQALESEI
jgi:hypothetical protein